MNWIKTTALIITMVLVFVIGALGVNQEELSLKFARWETPFVLSVFWWLLLAFGIGLLFGVLNGIWFNMARRLEARRLRKRVAQMEKELDQLKNASSAPTATGNS